MQFLSISVFQTTSKKMSNSILYSCCVRAHSASVWSLNWIGGSVHLYQTYQTAGTWNNIVTGLEQQTLALASQAKAKEYNTCHFH